MISDTLYACRHYPQSDMPVEQVKSEQRYAPKSILETREKNVKLYTEVVNVINIVVGHDSKSSPLGGDVVTPINDYEQEDSLKEMSSLVHDFKQTSLLPNVEKIQHVSPKSDLTHLSGLILSISFF